MIYVSPQTRLYNACLTKILYNMATKLISYRIDEEHLKKIDMYAAAHSYLSRSLVLYRILDEILNDDWKHNLWVLTHTNKKIFL